MSVDQIFDQLKIGTYADDWIKIFCEKSNGQDEWISLCGNYDGPAEGNKRVAVACSYTSNPFIKNESNFLFKKYSKTLKKPFNTMRQYTQDKIHREEIDIFLNHIITNNAQLVSSITSLQKPTRTTFYSQ